MKEVANKGLRIVVGIIVSLINIVWVLDSIYRMYLYNFTNYTYFTSYANWNLLLTIALASFGSYKSVEAIKGNISIKNSLIVEVIVIVIMLFLRVFMMESHSIY